MEFQKKGRRIAILSALSLSLACAQFSAYAAGPGDSLGKNAGNSTESSTNQNSSGSSSQGDLDYSGWYGYTNADGSDLKYLEKGTEVSKFQNENGPIDWEAAKKDGLDFVMIRLAYGTKEDAYFDENVKGAQKAGIKVGAYLCSTAKNMNEALAEAKLTVKKIKPYKFEYPVAYDLEVNSMLSEGLSKEGLTAMTNAYCKMVKEAGFIPMVYANKTWLTKHMNLSDLPYDVWFAAYPLDRVYRPVEGSATTIWQSSEKGVVRGIKGKVTTEFSWKAYGGGNPGEKNAGKSGNKSGNSSGSKGSSSGNNSNSSNNSDSGNNSNTANGANNGNNSSGNSSNAGNNSGKNNSNNSNSNSNNSNSNNNGNNNNAGNTALNKEENSSISSNGPAGEAKNSDNGWVQNIPGKWQYKENGKLVSGWKKIYDKWYFMDGEGNMQTGWVKDQNNWYYLDGQGAMKTGWIKEQNTWYYLKDSGAMAKNWQKLSGKWYWLAEDGAMRTGWKNINNLWYYMEDSGAMVENTTRNINGVEYRFDASGVWLP